MTQLHVLSSWHRSRFTGHVSIVPRVDHVLTKETYGNRFYAVSWPISTSCSMLISQWITFTPQCHDFYTRDSQHNKLRGWIEIGLSADMRRRCVAAVPDASTRAFTLQRQPDAYRSRPMHHVVVWCRVCGEGAGKLFARTRACRYCATSIVYFVSNFITIYESSWTGSRYVWATSRRCAA